MCDGFSSCSSYTRCMSDDSPQETLARLKKASDDLDAVQSESDITAQELARDHRTVSNALPVIRGDRKPKRKTKRPT
jgi:hypothetical protein